MQSEAYVLRNLRHKMKAHRTQRNWSQEALAERAYLHRTYIAGIESGARNPSLRSLIKIANAFKVPVAELLTDKRHEH